MKKQSYLALAFLSLLALPLHAQVSFSDGKNSFEIGAALFSYYNYRFYPADENNHKKNNFVLRNAQLDFEGRVGRNIEFKAQYNFAKAGLNDNAAGSAEAPALMDAWVRILNRKGPNVKIGYFVLPYSRTSMCGYRDMAFIQRAIVGKGDIYSRRDLGIQFDKTLLNQRLNLYAGIYSGQGEAVTSALYGGDNDASGNPEFLARVDYSWPVRYRYSEIDAVHVPIPMFQVGINGRTANRRTPYTSDYAIKTVDGSRTVTGADFSFQYRGLSLQAEYQQMYVRPRDGKTLVYTDADPSTGVATLRDWRGKTDHFWARGYMAQANYHVGPLKSVFAVRYDAFNANDLRLFDESRNLSFAYNYMIDGFRSVIKLQYFWRLKKDYVNGPTDDQIRLGWQYVFK
ncbi:porin [Nostoc sp. NIES-2111]